MKLALLPNLTKQNAAQITRDVCKELDRLNIEYAFAQDEESAFSDISAPFLPVFDLMEYCDIVIAIGGDGSVLRAAQYAVPHQKPVLGINAGRLGFMAGLEVHELILLERLLTGEYELDRRMLLDVTLEQDGEVLYTARCINDISAVHGLQSKLIGFGVSCDGRQVMHYLADGVILSTPTGSTAYSLAAGGPVVDPSIECLLLTPICTHSLFARSIIFKKDSVISIRADSGELDDVYLSCDGEPSVKVPPGAQIIVKKSEQAATFVRVKSNTFLDVLNDKLAERRA